MELDIKNLIKEVLEQGYLMSLATADEGGVWVADVIYVFDDELCLYWMSSPEVRHSKAVAQNSRAAGSITVSGRGEDNLGIQFEGMVQGLEGSRYDLVKKHFAKRQKPIPKEHEDVLGGRYWYKLAPRRIDLIHEKHFGFKKQQLTLYV